MLSRFRQLSAKYAERASFTVPLGYLHCSVINKTSFVVNNMLLEWYSGLSSPANQPDSRPSEDLVNGVDEQLAAPCFEEQALRNEADPEEESVSGEAMDDFEAINDEISQLQRTRDDALARDHSHTTTAGTEGEELTEFRV